MMWWGNNDMSWWGWLLMSFGMVVFWGLVAWVVVRLVRNTRPPTPVPPQPEEILDERFARGEIDEDEYKARRAALREAHASSFAIGGQ